MKHNPDLDLRVERAESGALLRFTAARDFSPSSEILTLAELSLMEAAELARIGGESGLAFFAAKPRTILVNGWQSWSFAGETGGGEARAGEAGGGASAGVPKDAAGQGGFCVKGLPKRALLNKLNLYTDRPGPRRKPFQRPRRNDGEVLSDLLIVFRAGDKRLALASRGPDIDEARPPVSFRYRCGSGELLIEALAGGARFRAGEGVAEIRVFPASGYFELQDELARIYAARARFEEISFLGQDLVPGGYESWYNHYLDIDEDKLGADLAAQASPDSFLFRRFRSRGRPAVFQVDDGWEMAVGDWEAEPSRFPEGMGAFARRIEEAGFVPGLWLAPLIAVKGSSAYRERGDWLLKGRDGRPLIAGWNPGWGGDFGVLDLSLPEVGDYLEALFERVVEDWGYRYLKLDFLYAGLLFGAFARGGAPYEHYHRVMRRITGRKKDRRGRPLAWLGCGAALEPSLPHFPLMRIGADTRETWDWLRAKLVRYQGRPAAYTNLSHSIGRALLNRSLYLNDPDVIFLREAGMGYGEREKELIALTARLFGSQFTLSDGAGAGPGEKAFTSRIVELLDRIPDDDYGAERLDRDVFRVISRRESLSGFINLRSREFLLSERESERLESGLALSKRWRSSDSGLILEPRSISLSSASVPRYS